MRQPIKMMETYHRLKAAMEAGTYRVGGFLPNEKDLAKELGVSRNTLRPALARLAEENLIERISSKGTIVCDRSDRAPQPLTFLLPCADFISDTEHFEHSELFRRIFNGFVKVAFEYGCRVEVLPVSPTNNDEDIDWSKLEHLNSHSMVFVSSFWYHKIFPLLRERNCKVEMLDFQDPDRKYYDDDVRGWSTIVCRQDEMAKDAVRFLAALGNRKIAIMRRCLNEENHPSLRGYLEGLEVSGLKNAIWRDASVTGLEYKDAAKMINDFYRQTNFDALILDTGVIRKIQFTSSVNRCLGLPENVDILMTTDPERNCHLFPALSSCDFPYEEIGRLGARRLLGHEPGGASPEIRGHIVERESTGKKTAVFTARGSIAFNGINNNVVSIK